MTYKWARHFRYHLELFCVTTLEKRQIYIFPLDPLDGCLSQKTEVVFFLLINYHYTRFIIPFFYIGILENKVENAVLVIFSRNTAKGCKFKY